MDLLELLRWGINGTLDLFLHGVYSGLASLLGFFLTSWAIRLSYTGAAFLLHCPTSMPTDLERATRRLGWLAALFWAFTAHMFCDRLLGPF